MSKPVIEVKGLSKVYSIGHEQQAAPGTMAFRDVLIRLIHKPLEILTGHRLRKEKFWALKDVNFEVMPGEVIGIIGRNGSGKSTLLKILSRIVEPTEGTATLRGRTASLLEVGTGFHPELTGRENVFFNGAILGMSRREIRTKFDNIVAFSEIEQFLDTPVKYYSSGMYVRLAFAVAAHLDPDILMVDEVLAVGDAAFQEKCLNKMKEVASHGRTVFFVSHSMSSVKELCTKLIWMDHGQIKEIGDLEAVSEHYAASSINNDVDLAKRQRVTEVTGEAKITAIRVTGENKVGSQINSKKPMNIEFEIVSEKALENVLVHCVVAVGGAMGTPVLRYMSEFTDTSFTLKKGKNVITCVTEATNLVGGIYSLSCSILQDSAVMGHIDEIYDAATFLVEDLKVPERDQYINQGEAVYYVDHIWKQ
jgi:lipopolysaccharide transport system ATP-binding protein